MALTVGRLASLPGIGVAVVAGAAGLDREIRWVHTSELTDPTRWLTGGELLLTTGMRLNAGAAQRRFVERLLEAGLAGLGFGVGLGFDEVPPQIRKAGDDLGFPILEVAYETPFIAISEAVSSALNDERTREAETSLSVHQRLTGAMSEGAGAADLLDEIASITQGWLMLFDLRGETIAATGSDVSPDPRWVWGELPAPTTDRTSRAVSSHIDPGGSWTAMPVISGARKEAVLVLGKQDRLAARDRIVVHDAVAALGLLLSSRRAIAEAERRVAGDVIGEALSNRLSGPVLARRLELLGFPPDETATVMVAETDPLLGPGDLEELSWIADTTLGARCPTRAAVFADRVVALTRHVGSDDLAGLLCDELTGSVAPSVAVRVAVATTSVPQSVKEAYLSALAALRTSRSTRGVVDGPPGASYESLLDACPRPILESFVSSALGELPSGNGTLVVSVRAFVDAGGRWETAARALGVHRHTLRYRVRRAEELMGRDLSDPDDRLEVSMALKVIDASGPLGHRFLR